METYTIMTVRGEQTTPNNHQTTFKQLNNCKTTIKQHPNPQTKNFQTMKHQIYFFKLLLLSTLLWIGWQGQICAQTSTLFIDNENIHLSQNTELFIGGSILSFNSGDIISEQESNKVTLDLGNQLISETIPFATTDDIPIPLIIQTETVSENSRLSAATYPTAANNTPLPSTVSDLQFNEADIAPEALNRFWMITLTELTATVTFSYSPQDLAGNETAEADLKLLFHDGTQWVHIESGSSDGEGSGSYTATINQSGVYVLFAGDVENCIAGDVDEDGICDDVDDCIGDAIAFSLEQTICEGEEFEGFTESGTFVDTFTAQSGCDSTRTLELTVLPNILNELEATICEGEEFEGFTETGTFEDVFTASNGCDSTRILQLEVLPNILNELEVSICEGEEFEGFTESGTFENVFIASNGCDSTRILQLEVLPNILNELEVSICEGEEFEGFTESGTFEDVFTASNGCDSVRVLQLEVVAEIRTEIEASICEGEEFEGFTETGTFEDIFVSAGGCDSVRVLQLEVLPSVESEFEVTICEGEDFEGITEAGTYQDVLTAANGCDSLRTVILSIAPQIVLADSTVLDDTGQSNGSIAIVVDGNEDDYSFEWSNGASEAAIEDLEFGAYSVEITDVFGCSATFEFNVPLNTSVVDTGFLPLQIAPNPTQSHLMVQLPTGLQRLENVELQLLNVQGQVLQVWELEGNKAVQRELSLEDVQPGIYLLRLPLKERVYYAKVVRM